MSYIYDFAIYMRFCRGLNIYKKEERTMKRRDIIYLKENEFCITGAAIWMSEWELAELFYATQGEIRAAINRMLKDGAIPPATARDICLLKTVMLPRSIPWRPSSPYPLIFIRDLR